MKKVKEYISKEELMKGVLKLDNAQDKFMLVAIFYGIAGKRDLSELTNLKREDVNFQTKTITLKESERIIEMDDFLEKITKEAINQKVYYVEKTSKHGIEEIALNMACPYIMKPRPRSTNKNGLAPFSYSGMKYKYRNVCAEAGFDLSPNQLETAGVVDSLLKIKKEWTSLDIEFYLRVNNIKLNAYRVYKILKSVLS